jgi:pimeloyl-ACP methyl ester carboxylesterase
LHGGLGNSGNWGYQVPTLIANGYRVVVIDSRGHGPSTRDEQLYSYELMASDVLAVMNALHFDRAALVAARAPHWFLQRSTPPALPGSGETSP